MKTTTYKTANVMRSLVASLIILASFSGIANGENSNKEAFAFVGNGYNAQEFVNAELTSEAENWMNSNGEVAEQELTLQFAAYNAKEFVNAELASETESWINNNVEVAEPELAIKVAVYNAEEYIETEFAVEMNKLINNVAKGFDTEQPFNNSNELANN